MFELKLTGEIHRDIDTVYEAVGYAEALIDGLVKEEIAQNNENRKRMGIFLEMLSIQDDIKKTVESARRMRREEEKYCYGPLAGREDMPF
jgi:hypothetical protein